MDEYSSKSQALGFEYIDSAMAYVADGSFRKYRFAWKMSSIEHSYRVGGGAWSDAWSDALSCGLCVYSFDGFQNKRRSEFWTKMTEIWVTSVNDHFDDFIVCNSCALSILFSQ